MSTRSRPRACLFVAVVTSVVLASGCVSATTPLRHGGGDPGSHTSAVPPARAATDTRMPDAETLARLPDAWRNGADHDRTLLAILDAAEATATAEGREILRTGRAMSLEEGVIVRGSCWTYASAVYEKAGFSGKRRQRVVKNPKSGPYVNVDMFQAGDFLSYINHSYRGSEHSAIFVAWLDRARKEALMLSYVGSRRSVPGDYRAYLLSSVYMVQRPRPVDGEAARNPRGPQEPVWDGDEGELPVGP